MIDQRLSRDFPTKSAVHSSQKRTAALVASRGSGAKEHARKVDARNYNGVSLPDKARLAAEIAADRRLRPSDKVVAFALLFQFQNTKTGQCNPSYKALAESCGLTRRAAIKAVPRLEAAGLVRVGRTAGGRNQRNQFWFELETVTSETPFDAETVNAGTENGERSFTPEGEPEFTRIERGNLNAGNERRNLSRSSESFDRFWSAYPKKVSRKRAEQIFKRVLKKREATAAELIAGAERYAQQCREHGTEPRFVKHPTTWLNAGCWLDEPEPNEGHTKIFHRGRSLVAGVLHAGSLEPWGQP